MSQSFAEKYAKKSNTHIEALQDKQSSKDKILAEKNAANADISNKNDNIVDSNTQDKSQVQEQKNAAKAVDPRKKAVADLIYLVKGLDGERNAWYYVLVDRLKLQLFLKALNDEIIHLENYGKILYSAYGKEPPVEVTEALKEEYGI